MKTPLISIIIPCYKQAEVLGATLQSVWSQSYANWECIIVNDGSPDHTARIAKKWVEKDERFRYVQKENGGLSSARNAGLKEVKGDYIQFLDSDDLLDKDKLLESVNELANTKADLVITNFLIFEKETKNTKPVYCNLSNQSFNLLSVVRDWDTVYTIPIHCGFFDARLFQNIRFNELLKAKEDWMMWIEVFKQNPGVSFLDKPMALYRKNPKGMTADYSYMRKNLELSYEMIYTILPADLKPIFLKKLVSDSSVSILYYRKKFLKYKKESKLLMALSVLLLIIILILAFT